MADRGKYVNQLDDEDKKDKTNIGNSETRNRRESLKNQEVEPPPEDPIEKLKQYGNETLDIFSNTGGGTVEAETKDGEEEEDNKDGEGEETQLFGEDVETDSDGDDDDQEEDSSDSKSSVVEEELDFTGSVESDSSDSSGVKSEEDKIEDSNKDDDEEKSFFDKAYDLVKIGGVGLLQEFGGVFNSIAQFDYRNHTKDRLINKYGSVEKAKQADDPVALLIEDFDVDDKASYNIGEIAFSLAEDINPELDLDTVGHIKDGDYSNALYSLTASISRNAPRMAVKSATYAFTGSPWLTSSITGFGLAGRRKHEIDEREEEGNLPVDLSRKEKLSVGAIHGGIELVAGRFLATPVLDKVIGKFGAKQGKKMVQKQVTRMLKDYTKSLGYGFSEEALTGLGQSATDYIFGINPNMTKEQFVRSGINEGMMGAVSNVVFMGAGDIYNGRTESQTEGTQEASQEQSEGEQEVDQEQVEDTQEVDQEADQQQDSKRLVDEIGDISEERFIELNQERADEVFDRATNDIIEKFEYNESEYDRIRGMVELAHEYAVKNDVGTLEVLALMDQESNFRNVGNDQSSARGPLQVTDWVMKALDENKMTLENDISTLEGRVEAGVKYMKILKNNHGLSGNELIASFFAGPTEIKENGITGEIQHGQESSQDYVEGYHNSLSKLKGYEYDADTDSIVDLRDEVKEKPEGAYEIYREDTDDPVLDAEEKPQGLYTSIADHGVESFETRFDYISEFSKGFQGIANPDNPLEVNQIKFEHERFGLRKGEKAKGQSDAGIGALYELVSEEEFKKLTDMSQDELYNRIKEEFPEANIDWAEDSYDLLFTYGGLLSREEGYDSIVLDINKPEDRHLSEIVLLKNDIFELKEDQEYGEDREVKDVGLHAGDLGKAEYMGRMSPSRGTGHYGTGTYFFGSEKASGYKGFIKDGRPVHKVDFSNYNLYEPVGNNDAERLHRFLRDINRYALGQDFKDPNLDERQKYKPEKDEMKKQADLLFDMNEEELMYKLKKLREYANKHEDENVDTPSTKFMKDSGYEGVDVRDLRADNSGKGSVIYNVNEEDVIDDRTQDLSQRFLNKVKQKKEIEAEITELNKEISELQKAKEVEMEKSVEDLESPDKTLRVLSWEEVTEARTRYDGDSEDVSIRDLADEYDVGKSTMHRILNRETYKEPVGDISGSGEPRQQALDQRISELENIIQEDTQKLSDLEQNIKEISPERGSDPVLSDNRKVARALDKLGYEVGEPKASDDLDSKTLEAVGDFLGDNNMRIGSGFRYDVNTNLTVSDRVQSVILERLKQSDNQEAQELVSEIESEMSQQQAVEEDVNTMPWEDKDFWSQLVELEKIKHKDGQTAGSQIKDQVTQVGNAITETYKAIKQETPRDPEVREFLFQENKPTDEKGTINTTTMMNIGDISESSTTLEVARIMSDIVKDNDPDLNRIEGIDEVNQKAESTLKGKTGEELVEEMGILHEYAGVLDNLLQEAPAIVNAYRNIHASVANELGSLVEDIYNNPQNATDAKYTKVATLANLLNTISGDLQNLNKGLGRALNANKIYVNGEYVNIENLRAEHFEKFPEIKDDIQLNDEKRQEIEDLVEELANSDSIAEVTENARTENSGNWIKAFVEYRSANLFRHIGTYQRNMFGQALNMTSHWVANGVQATINSPVRAKRKLQGYQPESREDQLMTYTEVGKRMAGDIHGMLKAVFDPIISSGEIASAINQEDITSLEAWTKLITNPKEFEKIMNQAQLGRKFQAENMGRAEISSDNLLPDFDPDTAIGKLALGGLDQVGAILRLSSYSMIELSDRPFSYAGYFSELYGQVDQYARLNLSELDKDAKAKVINDIKEAAVAFRKIKTAKATVQKATRRVMEDQGLDYDEAYQQVINDLTNNKFEETDQEILEVAEEIDAKAKEHSKYMTWKDRFEDGGLFEIGENMANIHPAMRGLIPIVHTPMKMLQKSWQWSSPLSKKFINRMKGQEGRRGQMKAMSRLITAWGFMFAMAIKAGIGELTPPAEDHEDRKAMKEAGIPPASIKIGDQWTTYTRWGPIGNNLAISAIVESRSREPDIGAEETQEAWSDGLFQLINALREDTMFKGLNDILRATEGADSAEYYLNDLKNSLKPLYTAEKNWKEYDFFNKNPFYNEYVHDEGKVRLDTYGKPVKQYTRTMGSFTSKPTDSKIRQEVYGLGINLSKPAKHYMDVELKDELYRELIEYLNEENFEGMTSEEYMNELVNSHQYENLNPVQKKREIKANWTKVKSQAKDAVIGERLLEIEKQYKKDQRNSGYKREQFREKHGANGITKRNPNTPSEDETGELLEVLGLGN